MFLINSVFASIQGEGQYAGTPAIFVRFQGCPHRCSFCDTKETWEGSEQQISLTSLLEKILMLHTRWPEIIHVVFTGGEPLYGQNGINLPELINACFKRRGLLPHIETSGTEYPSGGFLDRLMPAPFVTISPKVKSKADAEFIPVRRELLPLPGLNRGEFKFLVDGDAVSVARVKAFVSFFKNSFSIQKHIYIQPIDFGREDLRTSIAVTQAVNLCKTYGWRLSCQMHKFLGIE